MHNSFPPNFSSAEPSPSFSEASPEERGNTIGTSAQTLDERPVLERMRLERGTLKKLLLLGGLGAVLLTLAVLLTGRPIHSLQDLSGIFLPMVIGLAFIFETMDSAAGMGFGTALAPLLLVMGFDPLAVVPALLLSQGIAGLITGGVHHEYGNARFSLKRPLNPATKAVALIASIGAVSIVASVTLAYFALSLPESVIKTYVGVLLLLLGIVAVVRRYTSSTNADAAYRPKRLIGFAALAGLNKGIGGGGYGPVVTLGGIYAGIYEKSATAITSMAEGFVSIAGIATFFAITAVGVDLDFRLLPSLMAGSLLAAVLAPYAVRVLPNRLFSYVIPLYAFAVGMFVLVKLYLI